MHRPSSAAAIGAFALGAIALGITAVVLWGSGRFFRETVRCVCYFEGSVEGLEVGAPVKARGVLVGRVVRIQLRFRQRTNDDRIPVFIELDQKRLIGLGAQRPEQRELDMLIKNGLRARLESQSFVTGALFVNFGMHPREPARFSELDPAGGYPEIPTVPRQLEKLGDSVQAIIAELEDVDFVAMTKAITAAASSIDGLAGAKLPPAVAELRAALGTYKKLGTNLDADLKPLLAEAQSAVGDARKALVGVNDAAGSASQLVAPKAALSVRLNEALGDVSRAAEAVRDLAEYLQRNPNALIVGKSK